MNSIPQALITRLKEKKKLLESGNDNHTGIKTALIVDGGAMKGAYAAGVISALTELGFENIFDILIAVSSGTIAASYFLSEQGKIAPKVFYEGLASKKFINLYKLHPAKVVGSEYGIDVFSKIFPLNQEVIQKSRSDFYMGVTDSETGREEYLDIKKGKIDVITGMYASSTVPLLQNKIVTIHGKTYLDGMIACGIPIDMALQRGCTDILIIENTPIGKPDMTNLLVLKLFFTLFKFDATPQAKKAIFKKKKRYMETLHEIYDAQKQGINIGFIAPKKVIAGTFSINSNLLKRTVDEGRKQTFQLFS